MENTFTMMDQECIMLKHACFAMLYYQYIISSLTVHKYDLINYVFLFLIFLSLLRNTILKTIVDFFRA